MSYIFEGVPIGPYYGPNRLLVVPRDEDGTAYQLNIFPDLFNEQLRQAGKPLKFYYLPDAPRMAKNESGDYMFHFTRFSGVLTADDNIAVASPGQVETAGGVLAFTTTLKIPDDVLDDAVALIRKEIKNNARYSQDKYFALGPDSDWQIEIGVVPIVDNDVSVSNLSPENISDPATQSPDNPWLWKMQGEGKGTINPVGNNAYTAMVGQYPAQIIEQAFHGVSSPVFVHNTLRHKFYTGSFKASVHGEWSAIFNHFSADLKARYLWAQADIQAAFNSAVKAGVITKSVTIDNEVLTPEREQMYEAQVDKVFDKFMDAAQKAILDVQPAAIENAKAADTGVIGVSFAMKLQHDEHHLSLDFNETIDETYLKDNTISAHLMGFYDVLEEDKKAEEKYFDTVHLAEGFRKIHVIASARAFWPEGDKEGDPIEQLLLEVGYPDAAGNIVYKNSGLFMDNVLAAKSTTLAPAVWTKDNKDRIIIFDFERQSKLPKERQNIIYVKRKVRFQIKPCVEIPDRAIRFPEEQTTEHSIEVKADALGKLIVGPVELNTVLDDRTKVEVTFRKKNRNPETIRFTKDTIGHPQFFEAWTLKPEDALNWSYQVTMHLASKVPGVPAITYTGEEHFLAGSMPLIVEAPMPPDDLKERIDRLKQIGADMGADF